LFQESSLEQKHFARVVLVKWASVLMYGQQQNYDIPTVVACGGNVSNAS